MKDFLLGFPPLKQIKRRIKNNEAGLELLQAQFDHLRMAVAESHLAESGDKLHEMLAFIRPKRVVGFEKIRLGSSHDGGYVMLDDFANVGRAYSLGISGEVSWDLEMAKRGIPVSQFDYSIERTPIKNPHFTFFKKKVDNFADLQVANEPKQILKIDIEGSEWDFFSRASTVELKPFSQIVAEFHDFDQFYEPVWRKKALRTLQTLAETHQLIHIHGNNWGPSFNTGKFQIPIALELSYASKSFYTFEETRELFPGPLDFPNFRFKPDISVTELARGVCGDFK